MQLLTSTWIAAALVLLLLVRGPYRGLPVVWFMLPFGAMAALGLPALGGASIIAADLAIPALAALLLSRSGGVGDLLGQMRAWRPGSFLALLFVYATVATIFFPRIFAGETEVFSIGRTAGVAVITIQPLEPGGGNVTQLFRLALGFTLFLVIAALMARRPEPGTVATALKVATLTHLGLGLMDLATFATGTLWIMEPFRTANYAMTESHQMAGLKRMIGGFSEASAFGYFALGLFGFWLRHWLDGGKRKSDGVFLLISTFLVLRSTSSSTYVGAAAFLLVVLAMQVWRMRSGGVPRRVAAFLVLVAALLPLAAVSVVVSYELNEGVRNFLDRALISKLESSSGVERMSWNLQALRNFVDTNLVGAGLGSVRASNWLIACLATIGIVGTALYIAFLASLFRIRAPAAARDVTLIVSASKSGALALLMGSLVVRSSPNLEHQFYAFGGIAVGLALGAARLARSSPRDLRPALSVPGPAQEPA